MAGTTDSGSTEGVERKGWHERQMERGGLRQIRPAPSKLAELPKVSSGGVPVYMAPRLSSMPMYQRLTPVGTSGHHIDVPQDISDADDVDLGVTDSLRSPTPTYMPLYPEYVEQPEQRAQSPTLTPTVNSMPTLDPVTACTGPNAEATTQSVHSVSADQSTPNIVFSRSSLDGQSSTVPSHHDKSRPPSTPPLARECYGRGKRPRLDRPPDENLMNEDDSLKDHDRAPIIDGQMDEDISDPLQEQCNFAPATLSTVPDATGVVPPGSPLMQHRSPATRTASAGPSLSQPPAMSFSPLRSPLSPPLGQPPPLRPSPPPAPSQPSPPLASPRPSPPSASLRPSSPPPPRPSPPSSPPTASSHSQTPLDKLLLEAIAHAREMATETCASMAHARAMAAILLEGINGLHGATQNDAPGNAPVFPSKGKHKVRAADKEEYFDLDNYEGLDSDGVFESAAAASAASQKVKKEREENKRTPVHPYTGQEQYQAKYRAAWRTFLSAANIYSGRRDPLPSSATDDDIQRFKHGQYKPEYVPKPQEQASSSSHGSTAESTVHAEGTVRTERTVRIAWRRDSSDPYNEAVHFAVASAWIDHVKAGKIFPIEYNSQSMTMAAVISDIKKTILDTRKRVVAASDKTDHELINDELSRLKSGRHEARRKHLLKKRLEIAEERMHSNPSLALDVTHTLSHLDAACMSSEESEEETMPYGILKILRRKKLLWRAPPLMQLLHDIDTLGERKDFRTSSRGNRPYPRHRTGTVASTRKPKSQLPVNFYDATQLHPLGTDNYAPLPAAPIPSLGDYIATTFGPAANM